MLCACLTEKIVCVWAHEYMSVYSIIVEGFSTEHAVSAQLFFFHVHLGFVEVPMEKIQKSKRNSSADTRTNEVYLLMSLVSWLIMSVSKKVWLTSFQLLKNKKVSLLEVRGGGIFNPRRWELLLQLLLFRAFLNNDSPLLGSRILHQTYLKAANSFQSYQLTEGERTASGTATGSHRQTPSLPPFPLPSIPFLHLLCHLPGDCISLVSLGNRAKKSVKT